MTDTRRDPALTPEQVAGLRSGRRAEVRAAVKGLSRRELTAWLRTPDGAEVLHDAFVRMPDYYVPGLLDEEVVVRWRVGRPPAESVERDLVLGPLSCAVRPLDPAVRPKVTLAFDSAGFVEMACAARKGVDLLLRGHLHIQGDVRIAMRMETLFGLGAGEDR